MIRRTFFTLLCMALVGQGVALYYEHFINRSILLQNTALLEKVNEYQGYEQSSFHAVME